MKTCWKVQAFIALLILPVCSSSNDTISLIAVGDISFDGAIRYFGDRGCGYSKSFDNVRSIISGEDFAIANFESPIVYPNMTKHPLTTKEIHLGAWPSSMEGLRSAGFDAVGLANNHIMDFGDPSINLTTKLLAENGIDFFGVTYGSDTPKAQEPLIRTIGHLKVGFLAYCSNDEGCYKIRSLANGGPALYKLSIVRDDIANLKERNVDLIVLLFHWGIEYRVYPSHEITKICDEVSDLGADVILGSHQHVVQGHTFKNKKLVVYSMGNFLFHRNDAYKWMFYHGGTVNEDKLKDFEATMNRVTSETQKARIYKISLSRSGVESAVYQNVVIIANNTDHCLQPTPVKLNEWTKVCSYADSDCLHYPIQSSNLMKTNEL